MVSERERENELETGKGESNAADINTSGSRLKQEHWWKCKT